MKTYIRHIILLLLCMTTLSIVAQEHQVIVQASECDAAQTYALPNGASLILKATPADNSRFVSWSDGNTDNPRTVTITDDVSFTAFFAHNDDISSSDKYSAIIYAGDCTNPFVGEFNRGALLKIVAEPTDGNQFKQWSDGNTENPRLVSITSNVELHAEFEPYVSHETLYDITVIADGCGTSFNHQFYGGTQLVLDATPEEGSVFVQWSDGNTDNPRTVTVTNNITYTAVFAKQTFRISFVNYDGSELQNSEVALGETPVYTGATPTKPADEQYTYSFNGWTPEIVAVTGEATYTAVFEAAPCLLASGTCGAQGDNLTWELSCEGALTISGTGAMAEFAKDGTPWNAHRDAISSVSIAEGVTSVGRFAFYECVNMASVAIPEGVTSIGDSAFFHCAALAEVVLPNTLTTIGYRAFRDCSALTSVTIPESVTSLGHGGTFQRCNALTTVNWNARNSEILPNADESYSPPFYSSEGGLPGITSFNFGENVERIPATLCYGMSGLTSITFPDGLKRIDNSAFSGCTGITSLTIPASVTKIDNSAFNACTSIENVTMLPETVPTFGSYIFSNITSNFSVIVPCGTIDAYKSKLAIYASKIKYLPLEYSVSGLVNDAVAGSVTVPANRCENMFTAVANEGYEFKQWSDGETANPREVILTQDTTLTAVFEQIVTGPVVIHNGENENLSNLDLTGTQSIDEIIVEPGGELNVDDPNIHIDELVIVADGTNSGQVHHGVGGVNADHIYLEYILNPCGELASPDRWYAFSVPFEVEIATGISRTCDSKTLVSGTDFLIKEYQGGLRALFGKGWSNKTEGSLDAGQFYMLGIDGNCNRWRFEKKAGQPFEGDTHVGYNEYTSGKTEDAGWNGLGNTMLEYMRLNMGLSGINYMVTYDNCYGRFVTSLIADINLCVGRPFFIQASSSGFFDFFFGNGLNDMPAHRAPAQGITPLMHFTLVDETQSTGIDHMFLTMHEDATADYTIGRDVARMTTNCTTAAQLWCTIPNGTELSAHGVAIPETETIVPLTLFAPTAGEYLLDMSCRAMNGYEVELLHNGVWVATLDGALPTVLDLNAGTNSDYALRISRRNIPTGMEDVQGDNAQSTKVIINDHLYILRAGHMYDAQGKQVK